MPHQCTNCGRTFPDGSKEMLSGCPDCGGNKFQFQPGDRAPTPDESGTTAEPSDPPEPPEPDTPGVDDGGVAGTVAEAAGTVRDWVGRDENRDRAGDDSTDWPAVGRRDPTGDPTRGSGTEDTAQASARTDVVDPNDLPDPDETGSEPTSTADGSAHTNPSTHGEDPVDDDTDTSPFTGSGDSTDPDSPGLDELRDELNEQFESIRIVSPGQYELNLMELYDRDEYIISLMEDGRYAIEVPEAWRDES